jgi:hypothetical protein
VKSRRTVGIRTQRAVAAGGIVMRCGRPGGADEASELEWRGVDVAVARGDPTKLGNPAIYLGLRLSIQILERQVRTCAATSACRIDPGHTVLPATAEPAHPPAESFRSRPIGPVRGPARPRRAPRAAMALRRLLICARGRLGRARRFGPMGARGPRAVCWKEGVAPPQDPSGVLGRLAAHAASRARGRGGLEVELLDEPARVPAALGHPAVGRVEVGSEAVVLAPLEEAPADRPQHSPAPPARPPPGPAGVQPTRPPARPPTRPTT